MIDATKLYDWQGTSFKKWVANNFRGIVVAPTGVGKTTFALFCMQSLKKKTIIIVPTIVLMKQWKQEVMEQLNFPEEDIGFVGDGHREIKKITIGVINSVRKEDLSQFGMVVCDEVHRYGSLENIKPLQGSELKICLGMTATLEREDGFDELLKMYLGDVIHTYKQTTAIDDGVLNKFNLVNASVDMPFAEKHAYDELDFVVKEGMKAFNNNFIAMQSCLKNYRDPKFQIAKKTIKAIGERRQLYSNSIAKAKKVLEIVAKHKHDKVIIFNEYIGMAERIYELLIENCYRVGIYHSNVKKMDVINDFTDGKINILVAVKSLNEGLNVKSANVGIMVSSNSVKRNTIQRLGRVIRKQEGKKAYFYQLYCNYTKEVQDTTKKTSMLKQFADSVEWI